MHTHSLHLNLLFEAIFFTLLSSKGWEEDLLYISVGNEGVVSNCCNSFPPRGFICRETGADAESKIGALA